MARNCKNWICRTQIKPADVTGTVLSILSAMDQLPKQHLYFDYSKQCPTALSSPQALTPSSESSKQKVPTPQPEAAHTHTAQMDCHHTATSITPVQYLTPPHHPPNARKTSTQRGVTAVVGDAARSRGSAMLLLDTGQRSYLKNSKSAPVPWYQQWMSLHKRACLPAGKTENPRAANPAHLHTEQKTKQTI